MFTSYDADYKLLSIDCLSFCVHTYTLCGETNGSIECNTSIITVFVRNKKKWKI